MMEKLFLDSSIIISILEGDSNGIKAAKMLVGSEAMTNIICYCEVLNKANQAKLSKAEELLSKILVMPIAIADGYIAKQIQIRGRKDGHHLKTLDALIAATAINSNAVFLTLDKDFERIQGLKKQIF